MRRWVWLVLGVGVGVYAQSSVGHHNGVYVYSPGRGDSAQITHAIESATADLSFMQRGIARKRLEDSTHPFDRFQVSFEGERVLLRINHHEYDLPLNGQAAKRVGLDGNEVLVSATLRGEDLQQVFRGDKGTRYLDYRFLSDGSVSLHTSIESKYLPHHIEYALTYRRAN
ncbi:MAG: hypothetical protein AAF997_08045 [Myxococcota bacterium]